MNFHEVGERGKKIKIVKRKNFHGAFTNPREAILLLRKLENLEFIDIKDRKCIYDRIESKIDELNSELDSVYKPEDAKHFKLHVPSKDTAKKFIAMLYAIEEGNYDKWRTFERDTADAFRAIVLPEYKPVAQADPGLDYISEFKPVDRVKKAALFNSGKKLNGSQLLEKMTSLKRKPKTLFISNPLVIPFLRDVIATTSSLKTIYLMIPSPFARDNQAAYMVAEERKVDSVKLQRQFNLYRREAETLRKEFGNTVEIQIRSTGHLLRLDQCFIIANLNLSNGFFDICLSSNVTETVFSDKCCSQVCKQGDDYISQFVNNTIEEWNNLPEYEYCLSYIEEVAELIGKADEDTGDDSYRDVKPPNIMMRSRHSPLLLRRQELEE